MNALAWDDYTAAITRIDFYYYKSPSTSKYITSVDDVLFNVLIIRRYEKATLAID